MIKQHLSIASSIFSAHFSTDCACTNTIIPMQLHDLNHLQHMISVSWSSWLECTGVWLGRLGSSAGAAEETLAGSCVDFVGPAGSQPTHPAPMQPGGRPEA